MRRPRKVTVGPRALGVLRRDPAMGRLVAAQGRRSWELREPFRALVRSIAGQQLSNRVGRTIDARVRKRFGSRQGLADASEGELRALGLSRRKAGYLRGVARFALAGGLRGMGRLADEAVIERLCALDGVGIWTAHMFLIFSLGRPDVWPASDYGIVQAARACYPARFRAGGKGGLGALGDRFRPYRSAAAMYLWGSLDGGG